MKYRLEHNGSKEWFYTEEQAKQRKCELADVNVVIKKQTIHDKFLPPLSDGVYYTCTPDMESAGLGETNPVEPKRVKLSYSRNKCLYAHCFNEETGKIDDDSNATAIVDFDDIFETYDEAWIKYCRLTQSYCKIQLTFLSEMLESIQSPFTGDITEILKRMEDDKEMLSLCV